MKTSLRLMIGLAASVGAAGLAQAAPACPQPSNVESHTLVAASTAGSGWLADLNQLLSSRQEKHGSPAPDAEHADATGRPGPHLRQPGPTQASSGHAPRHTGSGNHGRGADPVAVHAGGDQAPAISDDADTSPTLGWQSLLPGSIQ